MSGLVGDGFQGLVSSTVVHRSTLLMIPLYVISSVVCLAIVVVAVATWRTPTGSVDHF